MKFVGTDPPDGCPEAWYLALYLVVGSMVFASWDIKVAEAAFAKKSPTKRPASSNLVYVVTKRLVPPVYPVSVLLMLDTSGRR